MTITYTGKVANARLGGFSRLLLYWKGSIYKLMYKEMILFCGLYAVLSLVYRLALHERQKRIFEKIALHCEAFTNLIPLSFVLGFYVAIVITRWWNQFINIPWPDRVMMFVSTMLDGADERGRLLRRTLMRYLNLSSLLVFQLTSVSVKKRFPTIEHLIEAGIIHHGEVKAMEEVKTPHGKWWIPMVWACNLLKQAYKEGRISNEISFKALLEEVQTYRGNLGMLICYDWISVPLVYTQVTTLAAYTFFLGCLLGRQFLDPSQNYPGHNVDLYVPVFTLLQFFFYMGWLKVAEQLINPFGEDDDDFDMNTSVDRNLQVSLITVDELYGQSPILKRDAFFGEEAPECLPYTKSSVNSIRQPFQGSAAEISLSCEEMKLVNPLETIHEVGQPSTTYAASPYLPVTSRSGTPLPSPANSRLRLTSSFLSGQRSTVSFSRGNLDMPKARHPDVSISLLQTLEGAKIVNGSLGSVSEATSCNDVQRNVPNQVKPHQLPSPCEETKKAVYPPPYTESDTAQNKRFTVQPAEIEDATRFSSTSSTRSLSNDTTPHSKSISSGVASPNSKSLSYDTSPNNEKEEKEDSYCSSNESLPRYEAPPANQCTVNSLTPLLVDAGSYCVNMDEQITP